MTQTQQTESAERIARPLIQQRIADTLVEPTVVKFIGKEAVTPIRAKGNDVALKLTLEDGTEYAGDLTAYLTGSNADDGSLQLTLPDDIPAGYHTRFTPPRRCRRWSRRRIFPNRVVFSM